jgi:protein kinase C and casein kinase substrate in neurons protein
MASKGFEVPLSAGVTDSFWETNGFKRVVQRTQDGRQQCRELKKLIQERADIEGDYAKQLHTWSRKWAERIENGT